MPLPETSRRCYGISSSLLFRWRRLMEHGELESLGADEEVAAASEVKQLQARVRGLERLLGKKTLEAEILKEALELTRSKNLLLRSTLRGRFQVKPLTLAQLLSRSRDDTSELLHTIQRQAGELADLRTRVAAVSRAGAARARRDERGRFLSGVAP
jgi:transposase-like protein